MYPIYHVEGSIVSKYGFQTSSSKSILDVDDVNEHVNQVLADLHFMPLSDQLIFNALKDVYFGNLPVRVTREKNVQLLFYLARSVTFHLNFHSLIQY